MMALDVVGLGTELMGAFHVVNGSRFLSTKECIQSLPISVRYVIYRINAVWGGMKGDLRWGEKHCPDKRGVVMGMLMVAYTICVGEQWRRGVSISDKQIQDLSMLRWAVTFDPEVDEPLVDRVNWNISKLPPLVQLRL